MLKPILSYIVQQVTTLALKGAMKGIETLQRLDVKAEPSQPLTHKDVNHIQEQIRSATTGNKCSICGTRGAVISKYLPKPVYSSKIQGHQMARAIVERGDSPIASMPITWKCCQCHNFVCFNCTLVIPYSEPPQFYGDTYCSEACKDTHRPCPDCKKPLVCRVMQTPDELADEVWFCANIECQTATNTSITT